MSAVNWGEQFKFILKLSNSRNFNLNRRFFFPIVVVFISISFVFDFIKKEL